MAADELAGFDVGDVVSFVASFDAEVETVVATALEAEDEGSLCQISRAQFFNEI